jgi:hypothetical protein
LRRKPETAACYSFNHPKVDPDSFVRFVAQVFRQSRRACIPGSSESSATQDQKADGKNDPPIERSCLTKKLCDPKILGVYTARTQQRFSTAPAEFNSGQLVEKEIDGSNPAVPGNNEISPGISRCLTGAARYPVPSTLSIR